MFRNLVRSTAVLTIAYPESFNSEDFDTQTAIELEAVQRHD